MTLPAGSRLGPYEILAPLGAGGMGEVYRARDSRLGRDVALKVLPDRLANDPGLRGRFEREAKAVAALSHPNILALFDLGKEGGRDWAVTELLEGETLRQRLDAGPLAARKAAEYGVQIARGLAAAHDRGVVHRDLKPENLFLTRDGVVKILDFGLARQAAPTLTSDDTESPTAAPSTEPGTLLGTVGYMAPEQVRGQEADARADVFSFGSVLYEMLTGRRAFARDTAPETLTAILREEPPELPPSVPSALERIVHHCLEKRPEQRFRTAHDLAFALDSVFGSSTVSGVAVGAAPPSSRWRRSAALVAGAGVLAGLAFVVGRRSVVAVPGVAALPAFHQLTDGPARKGSPSLSPDGKTFAYVSDETGNADIFLQRVGGGNPINLTKDSPADDVAPAFSPDGEHIAFRSGRQGGGIFVMGATGESVRRLGDFGFDPAWSPDGAEIVVAEDATESPLNRSGLTSNLWAIRVKDGLRRLVGGGDATHPVWSPGGHRVAYWGLRRPGSQRDLWTIAADGSEAKGRPSALTADAALDWSPDWSPDGRYLYFSSDRGGPLALWRLPLEERTGRALGPPQGLGAPTPWTGGVSLSREGKTAVFEGREPRQRLVVAEIDPARGTLVSAPRTIHESTHGIFEVSISPDGRRVAYGNHGGEAEDLWILDVESRGLRQLTQDAMRDRGPSWSPDGEWLLFRSEREGGWGLWAVRPDGSGLKRLTPQGVGLVWSLVWSPRGDTIAGYSPEGTVLVDWTVGADAARIRPLPEIEPGLRLMPGGWSPDGRRLFGTGFGAGRSERGAYVFDLDSSRFTRLLDDAVDPLWLDGGRLLTRARDGVRIAEPGTGRSRLLLPGRYDEILLSRDRRQLLAVEDLTASDIWLMTPP